MSTMHAHVLSVQNPETDGLRQHVAQLLREYFNDMDNQKSSNNQALKEVEAGLYDAVMKITRGNQSQAARFLGVSRGTLRSKLKEYFGTTHVGVH